MSKENMNIKDIIKQEKEKEEKLKAKKKISKEEKEFFGMEDELHRRNFVIYNSQYEKLKKEAFETDMSMSEILRKAIDDYYKRKK